MNKSCARCRHASNLINGRYCNIVQHYVEHCLTMPCMESSCVAREKCKVCVNGSYCTKAERYIEHRTDQPCAPKGRFSSLSALISHAGEQLPTEGAKGRQNENNKEITSTTKQR